MDAYKHVLSGDFCEYYDMLVGPDGFECLLTEPEDRNWYRDGRVVIDRLNAQHAELTALHAEVERLRVEVAMYRSALASALGIPQPMLAPPEKEE